MSDQHRPQSDPSLHVPARLEVDLRRIDGEDAAMDIPSLVDEQIVRMAARHIAGGVPPLVPQVSLHEGSRPVRRSPATLLRHRRLIGIRWIACATAAAVMLAVSIMAWPVFHSSRGGSNRVNAKQSPSAAEVGGHPVIALAAGVAADVNSDGAIDILDAQRLSYLLHNQPGDVKREWDISLDGRVDDGDAQAITRYVVTRKDGGA